MYSYTQHASTICTRAVDYDTFDYVQLHIPCTHDAIVAAIGSNQFVVPILMWEATTNMFVLSKAKGNGALLIECIRYELFTSLFLIYCYEATGSSDSTNR